MPTINKDPACVGSAELAAAIRKSQAHVIYLRRRGRIPAPQHVTPSFVVWNREQIVNHLRNVGERAAARRLQTAGAKMRETMA